MKHTPSLFARLLVPVLLFLALLPPAACLIFRHAALSYAFTEAESDLETLQQSVLPLMSRLFLPTPQLHRKKYAVFCAAPAASSVNTTEVQSC